MNQVQSIMSLMKHDLNASQLAKLQSVLEAVLTVQKDLPSVDDLIKRFETSKRLMGIKDTSLCQYTLEVRMLSKNMSKPLNQLTTTDIKDYLSRYRSEHSYIVVGKSGWKVSSVDATTGTTGNIIIPPPFGDANHYNIMLAYANGVIVWPFVTVAKANYIKVIDQATLTPLANTTVIVSILVREIIV